MIAFGNIAKKLRIGVKPPSGASDPMDPYSIEVSLGCLERTVNFLRKLSSQKLIFEQNLPVLTNSGIHRTLKRAVVHYANVNWRNRGIATVAIGP